MGALSASILAADLARLGEQVKLVEPYAEVFHVDVMDGHFAPPISFGGVVVQSLRPVTDRKLHGHLMVEAPERQFEELREAGLDMVSFHLEAVPHPLQPSLRYARRIQDKFDQVPRGTLVQRTGDVLLAQDSNHTLVLVDDRKPGDVVPPHEPRSLEEGGIFGDGNHVRSHRMTDQHALHGIRNAERLNQTGSRVLLGMPWEC